MTAWWSEERINDTVKSEYIERELGSKKYLETLHSVPAFGDGLTDDTYLEWILKKSRRVFLILNQIGVPEKIFEVVDRSFADDDLPLSQDALWELNLFGGKSETLDKKFYREQFNYLVQELEPGSHVDYGTWEVVPVEPVAKRPGIPTSQASTDKVHVHKVLYTRKKVARFGDNGIDGVHFVLHLKALATIQHPHLVSIWATYSQDDYNYILLSPPAEVTLRAFLDEPPKAFKLLEKHERRNTFLTWVHCLTSALSYLHDQGLTHQSIRPSTIFIDHRNSIFFNDFSALRALDTDDSNKPYSNELYDYSAPERWLRKPCLHETTPLNTYLPGGGRTSRRIPKRAPPNPEVALQLPSTPKDVKPSKFSLSRTDSKSASSGSSTNARPRNALITTLAPIQRGSSVSSSSFNNKRDYASDIFSHTAILLTILSQILQHTPKSFASHRSRLNRQAGRGNAPPDSSFHKNLTQVDKWIGMLAKEAGQREKKDMKFWGAVVEVVQICRLGIKKEAKERIGAKEMEHKIAGWVEWGLSGRRKCNCNIKEETEVIQGVSSSDSMSEPEPASQYRIPTLQGSSKQQQVLGPVKPKVDFSDDASTGASYIVASVQMGPGSTRAGNVDPYKTAGWGLDDLAHLRNSNTSTAVRHDSIVSDNDIREGSVASSRRPSTVWGLEDVSEDDRLAPLGSDAVVAGAESGVALSLSENSCIAVGIGGGSASYYDEYDAYEEEEEVEGDDDDDSGGSTDVEVQREDWPLPLGTLTLS